MEETSRKNLSTEEWTANISKLSRLREDLAAQIQLGEDIDGGGLLREGLEYADDLIETLKRMRKFLESKLAQEKTHIDFSKPEDQETILFGVDRCFLCTVQAMFLSDWIKRAGIDRKKYFGETA